jgi:hypothetical protein
MEDSMAKKREVPLSESYNYLKKSLDHLNNQQSTGQAPELYPDVNSPSPQSQQPNESTPNTPAQSDAPLDSGK